MKIAIPVCDGLLATHFGHCEEFALIGVGDDETISGVERVAAPPHSPGLLPEWLRQNGVDVVIASGMGRRARMLFEQGGVEVAVGAPRLPPERIAKLYVAGELELGSNVCDH